MKTISTALNYVLAATTILFAIALSSGAAFEEILAISFTGVVTTILIAFNERMKN